MAIKQTLYRTSGDSPIINALIEAAESGKHVTAVSWNSRRGSTRPHNISWAQTHGTQSGVHVVFGFMDLKTHCKLALVVRHEGGEEGPSATRTSSTGNYNPTTAQALHRHRPVHGRSSR